MEEQSYINLEITLPEGKKTALQEFLDDHEGKIIRENPAWKDEKNDSANNIVEISDEDDGQLVNPSTQGQAELTQG